MDVLSALAYVMKHRKTPFLHGLSDQMNENIETNRQLALSFLDLAFNMKMDAAVTMLTDDATWWVIGDPSRIKVAGLKDHRKTVRMLTGLHKFLPHGMRHEIVTTTAEGDRVAVEVEAEGHWHDGRPYRNIYHFLLRIRDGKIASVREYMDATQLL